MTLRGRLHDAGAAVQDRLTDADAQSRGSTTGAVSRRGILAGANHGVCVCPCCCDTTVWGNDTGEPCQFIGVQCFGVPGHPLYELNLPTETPGDVEYHTVRGYYDYFYACNPTSPYLAGADNNLLYTDHVGTLESAATKGLLADWLA